MISTSLNPVSTYEWDKEQATSWQVSLLDLDTTRIHIHNDLDIAREIIDAIVALKKGTKMSLDSSTLPILPLISEDYEIWTIGIYPKMEWMSTLFSGTPDRMWIIYVKHYNHPRRIKGESVSVKHVAGDYAQYEKTFLCTDENQFQSTERTHFIGKAKYYTWESKEVPEAANFVYNDNKYVFIHNQDWVIVRADSELCVFTRTVRKIGTYDSSCKFPRETEY